MTDFYSMLNWKLLTGSHDFPGPDGGTCINEAAIVAAGFKYKKVSSWRDCPPCFSPVISSYALALNDHMPSKARNELLLPFVTRLAGTADSFEVEKKRVELIVRRTELEIANVNTYDTATARAAAARAAAAYAAARAAADYAAAADAAAADAAAAYATYAAAYATYDTAAAAAADANADAAEAVTYAAARAAGADTYAIWKITASILDEAINLGNHSNDFDQALILNRMNAARKLVTA